MEEWALNEKSTRNCFWCKTDGHNTWCAKSEDGIGSYDFVIQVGELLTACTNCPDFQDFTEVKHDV
jgi:hypothetical protein